VIPQDNRVPDPLRAVTLMDAYERAASAGFVLTVARSSGHAALIACAEADFDSALNEFERVQREAGYQIAESDCA
jgi:hypothetical protein